MCVNVYPYHLCDFQVELELQAKAKLHQVLSSAQAFESQSSDDVDSVLERLKNSDVLAEDASNLYNPYEHLHMPPPKSSPGGSESGKQLIFLP